MKRQKELPLGVLCSLVYFTSYITRTNYGAVMAELIPALGLTKALASMAVTGSFLSYGAGQLVCGWLGDRIEPRRMIACGLLGTALCNFAMTGLRDPWQMAAMWTCNGFFQSMLWPPLLRMMAFHLEPLEYAKSTVRVLGMSSVGTIVVYLMTPVCITAADWRLVFLLPAVVCVLVAIYWLAATRRLGSSLNCTGQENSLAEKQVVRPGKLIRASALPAIAAAIILIGLLRDGITTWMPVYLAEAFRIDHRYSILVSSLLPLFSILGLLGAEQLNRRARNELRSACLLYALAFVCGLVVIPLWNRSLPAVLLLLCVVYGAVHGVNLMLISRVPSYFLTYGCVAVVSGVLNTFTYVGSSASSFGISRVAESLGWRCVLILWTAGALLGLLLTFCAARRWAGFVQESRQRKLEMPG